MPFHYCAFGLNIESEIECPYLVQGGFSIPDLVVRWGAVPHELEQVQERGAFHQIGDGRFLLKVNRVGRYLVTGGREIVVEARPDAAPEDVRLFLLGSAMGALLHQRGVWPLHGSAIAGATGAVLFVGATGSGKSTLAGVFHRRGFQVLSDDVCALTIRSDGLVQVWPAYPRISLWADSVVELGAEPGQLGRTHTAEEKYDLPLVRFGREPVAIQVVYVLQPSERESISLMPLRGFDKVQELTANTYRLHYLTGMKRAPQHFQQAQALARQARVVRVTRPTQPFLLAELAGIIERDLAP